MSFALFNYFQGAISWTGRLSQAVSGASDGRQQIQTSAFDTNSTSSEFILLTRTCQGQLLDDRTCRLQTSTATPLPALSFPFQLFRVQAQCPPTLFHLFQSFQFRLIFISGQSLCFSVFFSIFSVFNFATPVSDKNEKRSVAVVLPW